MSYKNDLLTKLNTLAFFKKCRACEEGLDEVSEMRFRKIYPHIPPLLDEVMLKLT